MVDEKETFKDNYKYFLTRVKKSKVIIRELLRHTPLKTTDKLKVLAVGGEYGFIEYNLAKWTKWDILSSDINENLIRKYGTFNNKVSKGALDTTMLPFKDNTFDLIIFNHVIEHIPEYRKAVKELHRVLKKKGYFYLATPNLHRKFVHLKISLVRKKNLSDEKRMSRHMGFSCKELEEMLSIFMEINNITKEHQVTNLKIFGKFAKIIPGNVFHKYSQTNAYICRK